GPSSNQLSSPVDPEIDAVSRMRTDNQRNRGASWFGGNLLSAGDEILLYQSNISFGLPVSGTALSPGEANTGTTVQSPLTSLLSVVSNPNGTVTATFSGVVSQLTAGDGSAAMTTGAGITLTDINGVVIPSIDARPTVTGLGTTTLTIAFTGSGVVNGHLPAGSYKLNFVGNALISNSRATDVANNGTQINGFRSETLIVAPQIDGDFDNDGDYDCADINALTNAVATGGSVILFDLNGDTTLSLADVDEWRAEAGGVNLGAGRVYRPGDANLDSVVDGSDFGVWNSNKFTLNTNWCSGNFDANSGIDGSDFGIWNNNKFTSADIGRGGASVKPDSPTSRPTTVTTEIGSFARTSISVVKQDAIEQRALSVVSLPVSEPRQGSVVDRVFAGLDPAEERSRRIRNRVSLADDQVDRLFANR
ncbi:MAG TPA: hypothetical protein VIY86_08255, partial [Pirellulaceae bacterium]